MTDNTTMITIYQTPSDRNYWHIAVAKDAQELLQHFDDPTNSYEDKAIIEYPNPVSTVVVTYDSIKPDDWTLAIKFIKRYREDYTIKRIPQSEIKDYFIKGSTL